MKAADKFSTDAGYKFPTYATGGSAAVTRSITDQARTIRIPVHMIEVANKIIRLTEDAPRDRPRTYTEELAESWDAAERSGKSAACQEPLMETPIGDEGMESW
jgi:RNA polymerase primary sigma factor